MATVKKASTASKKSAAGKKNVKKVVVAKKAAPKPPIKVKKAAVKKATPTKAKATASKPSPAKSKVEAKKTVAKKVVPVKKSNSKVAVAPAKKATPPAKKSVEKKAPEKKPIPTGKNADSPRKNPNKDIELQIKESPAKKVEKLTSKKAEASKQIKASKDIPPVNLKSEDKLEPLQAKAQKVMKELEETMDLSKVRPRIQAGTTPTPPSRPVIRMKEPPLKLVEPTNTTKVKYQLEFEFRSSPKILFNCLSDASGLAGWFADEVKTKDSIYTFVWEGGESYAKLVGLKDLHLVRFQWLDDTDGTYFQFEIKEDDITTDIALEITDFANPGEKETSMRLWESQVQKLRMLLGSL